MRADRPAYVEHMEVYQVTGLNVTPWECRFSSAGPGNSLESNVGQKLYSIFTNTTFGLTPE